MTDIRRVQQAGNSLTITLPEHIVRHLHLAKGSCVEIDLIDTRDGSVPFVKLWKAADDAQPRKNFSEKSLAKLHSKRILVPENQTSA